MRLRRFFYNRPGIYGFSLLEAMISVALFGLVMILIFNCAGLFF